MSSKAAKLRNHKAWLNRTARSHDPFRESHTIGKRMILTVGRFRCTGNKLHRVAISDSGELLFPDHSISDKAEDALGNKSTNRCAEMRENIAKYMKAMRGHISSGVYKDFRYKTKLPDYTDSIPIGIRNVLSTIISTAPKKELPYTHPESWGKLPRFDYVKECLNRYLINGNLTLWTSRGSGMGPTSDLKSLLLVYLKPKVGKFPIPEIAALNLSDLARFYNKGILRFDVDGKEYITIRDIRIIDDELTHEVIAIPTSYCSTATDVRRFIVRRGKMLRALD